MRAVLCAVLALSLGCGKIEDRTGTAATTTESEPGKSAPNKPDPLEPPIKYAGEYDKGNPIAADKKYKGKRVTFSNVEVDKVDRLKDGRAYVAPLSVLLQAPSRPAGSFGSGGSSRVPEPCYFFFMSDEQAAGIKPGDRYEITGVCRGYEKDGYWRGNVPGMNWHVDLEDCTAKPVEGRK